MGVTGKPQSDDTGGGNHFAHSFRRAAEQIRARFRHDSFEASVLQVAERDLGEFMEALSAGAYTRPLLSSTCAVSDTKYTLNTP